MTPSDLYSVALSVLTNTRSVLVSPAWQASLDAASPSDRVAAGNNLIQLQGAILALSNASLSDIAKAMQANENELIQCTSSVTNSLKQISNVENVMKSVAGLLNVASKIVPLI